MAAGDLESYTLHLQGRAGQLADLVHVNKGSLNTRIRLLIMQWPLLEHVCEGLLDVRPGKETLTSRQGWTHLNLARHPS